MLLGISIFLSNQWIKRYKRAKHADDILYADAEFDVIYVLMEADHTDVGKSCKLLACECKDL